MQFELKAPNPEALLRSTLNVLAEKFGGYKDGSDFLDLFDEMIDGVEPEVVTNGLSATRALINNVRGATAAYQLEDTQEAIFVPDTPEDEHAEEDADIQFVDPTQADADVMNNQGGDLTETFIFGARGPGIIFGTIPTADGPISRFPDFGLGSDIVAALHGASHQNGPAPTVEDILESLDPVVAFSLVLLAGPALYTIPIADVEELARVAQEGADKAYAELGITPAVRKAA